MVAVVTVVALFLHVSGWRNGCYRLTFMREKWNCEQEAVTVREVQEQAEEARNHHILFPVAVGAIFLVMLVIGAMFG